jgi:hypothetical protein
VPGPRRTVPDDVGDLREVEPAELGEDLRGVVHPAEHDLCEGGATPFFLAPFSFIWSIPILLGTENMTVLNGSTAPQ